MSLQFLNLKKLHAEIDAEIQEAMQRVMAHGQFINGPEVKALETEFAAYCQAPHAVGCSSGTSALHAILHAIGLRDGDEVLMPSHTFIATAESIRLTGAKPVFVDVDPATWLLDPGALEAKRTPRTKAVVAVHLYGMPCAMDAINAWACEHGLLVIEDAAQAHGATLNGRRAGSLGFAASFSFFPGKNLGAFGDAGAATFLDEQTAHAAALYINHGRTQKYEHLVMGNNYRLDTLQAGILLAKLAHLDKWNDQRRRLASAYRQILSTEPFASLPLGLQADTPGADSCWHLFVVTVPERDRVAGELKKRGVPTGVHYPIPCHLQPSMADVADGQPLPVTEQLAQTVLSLPMCPTMTEQDVVFVCDQFRAAIG